MTQPAQTSGGPLSIVTRRLGPLPVWLWLLLLITVVAAFLLWRKSRSGQSTGAVASNAYTAPNLTNQPSSVVPYTSDIFVNVQQPGATGATGPEGPTGPTGPVGPQGTPATPVTPFLVSAGTGANLYDFAAAHGGWATLMTLNPWFSSNIIWGPEKYPDGSIVPHVKTGRQYLVTK